MKWLKHIINMAVWTLIGVYILTIVAFHIPAVQNEISLSVAETLAEELNTKVEVGRVDLGFLNRLVIDDAIVYDQQGRKLFKSARLTAKLELLPLLSEGSISISTAQVFGASLKLYQADSISKPNYQFVLDAFASDDTTSSSSLNLRINSFIMRHCDVSYDRWDIVPTHGKLNLAHLKLTDINANLQLRALTPDTINANVRRISLKEQSGLTLERLSFKLEGGLHRASLRDFTLRLPGTELSIPSVTASYSLTDEKKFVDGTLHYQGEIAPSTLSTKSFGWLVPTLRNADESIHLSATFQGDDKKANLTQFNIDGLHGELALRAAANAWFSNKRPAWSVDLKTLSLTPKAIDDIATLTGKELPAAVHDLGNIRLVGNIGCDEKGKWQGDCQAKTDAGSTDMDFTMLANKDFKANVLARDIALGTLTGQEKLGNLSAAVALSGSLADTAQPTVKAKGTIDRLSYNDYNFTGLEFDADYASNAVGGTISLNDPNINARIEGKAKKAGASTAIDLTAIVNDICPSAIHLTNKWGNARFSGKLDAHGQGASLASATGSAQLTDFTMKSDDTNYELHQLAIASGTEDRRQFITLNADFGHAEIVGRYDHATVFESLMCALDRHLPSLRDHHTQHKALDNDFLISGVIRQTDFFEKVLQVPVSTEGTLTLTGKVDDAHHHHYINASVPSLTYANQHLKHLHAALNSTDEALYCDASAERITENDRLTFTVNSRAQNDSIDATATWKNTARMSFSGKFNAIAHLTQQNGKPLTEVTVKPSQVNINGKEWKVSPAYVAIAPSHISVDHFSIQHGEQHLSINGEASKNSTDTVTVDLNGIDVAYVLNLVDFHAVDFGGLASGRAYLTAPFASFDGTADLTVKQFTFEDGRMGTLYAKVDWNEVEKQIDIHATANDGPASMTFIDGYVSPSRNHIDLGICAAGTQLYFMRSFTNAFLSDISGQANGSVRLSGPLSAINLTGLLVADGTASVTSTGCTYYLKNDTVLFLPNEIMLENGYFTDGRGGEGKLNAFIHHQHLSHMSYDMDAEANNMLVYDFKDFGENTFYGTVYGTGNVNLTGRSTGLLMTVNITPLRGSTFVYNVSSPDAVASQDFIRWNDGSTHHHNDTAYIHQEHAAPQNNTSDLNIDFRIGMTPDATIRLLMDSKTGDYITLQGNGELNATYYNKGAFEMNGTYNVTGGTYGITIQNIIKKKFQFNDGGTITFRGDPYDADLNLQAIYTVNGVSLSDLNLGSSFSNNTVRVNCKMDITGKPNSPTVDFGIDFPTVSADESQMIRSVLNSENEMNQQVLYLLAIGRFYPQGANNASAQNERQQDQASLAMQSLLSGTISSQINSVLGTVIKSNNWNFGANISTGDEGWNNAEYEGLLSGRLFNNRLLFNGQFGYRDKATTASTSFIGDFDIRYLLLPNGNLAIKMYNQTNDRYFTKSSLNTQGLGLIIKRDFNGFSDFFGRKKSKVNDKKKE